MNTPFEAPEVKQDKIPSTSGNGYVPREIEKEYRMNLAWTLSSEKEPDLRETDHLFKRIDDFYAVFLEKNKETVRSFFFDLSVNEERFETKLEVSLCTGHYIPPEFVRPPYTEFQDDADRLESSHRKGGLKPFKLQILLTAVQNQGGSGPGPKN